MRELAWMCRGLVSGLVLFVFACGGDGGGGNVDTVSRLIGEEGGTLELSGGGKLVIPAGALLTATEIKITKLELNDVAALPSNLEPAGKPYAFEPFSLVFAAPVKLEVPFDGAGTEVRPMKLPNRDAETSQWTTVFPNEKVGGVVSAEVTTLGVVLAARPRRGSGVVTLADGAVVEDAGEDAGMDAGMDADVMVEADAAVRPVPWVWAQQFGIGASSAEAAAVVVDGAGAVIFAGTVAGALPGQTAVGSRDAFVRKCDGDGVPMWTRQFGADVSTDALGVGVDGAGNVFVAGATSGTFEGQTSAGDLDVFVRKYDGNGTELWTRQFGSSGRDTPLTATADSAGNVYVAGYLFGTLAGQTSAGSFDAFVRKYDGNGAELWTRQFGSTGFDIAEGLAVDGDGNLYVGGRAGAALPGQTQVGDNDVFVRKYDSTGTELWTRQFGTAAWDDGRAIAVDRSGDVVIFGETYGAFPGHTNPGTPGLFARKYSSDGTEGWTWQFGSDAENEASAMVVDDNDNVVITGRVRPFDNVSSDGTWDVYVSKYNDVGTRVWSHTFGTTEPDLDAEAGNDLGAGVATDNAGNVFVVGHSEGPLEGQTASGYRDAFIMKFAP